jgi:hypothetical protein
MSMWVAPSVAAEIWGMSIDHILAGVADGSISSYVDGQFLFVDIEGRGLPICTPPPSVSEPAVTPEEFAALTFQPITQAPENLGQDGEEDSPDISDWREVREQTARLRQPPQTEAA